MNDPREALAIEAGQQQAAREARRQEILAMEAGPALNALVAEQVFGWVRAEPDYRPQYAPLGYVLMPPTTLAPYWHVAVDDAPRASDAWILVPPYSTDVAAAWSLVPRLNDLGFEVELKMFAKTSHCQVRVGETDKPPARCTHWFDRADTFHLALCRAGLLATSDRQP